MLLISLKKQMAPASLEHPAQEVVEKYLDLSVFDACYHSDQTGAAIPKSISMNSGTALRSARMEGGSEGASRLFHIELRTKSARSDLSAASEG